MGLAPSDPLPRSAWKESEKEEAQELIEQRIQKIKPYVSEDTQVNPSTTPNETI